eukprot:m.6856 g.6856  ORF g.6856 m.6856 type:complete len:462 (-) comp3597_c0_seq1:2038-3423(-)
MGSALIFGLVFGLLRISVTDAQLCTYSDTFTKVKYNFFGRQADGCCDMQLSDIVTSAEVPNESDCQKMCKGDNKCSGYTFDRNDGEDDCYLFHNAITKSKWCSGSGFVCQRRDCQTTKITTTMTKTYTDTTNSNTKTTVTKTSITESSITQSTISTTESTVSNTHTSATGSTKTGTTQTTTMSSTTYTSLTTTVTTATITTSQTSSTQTTQTTTSVTSTKTSTTGTTISINTRTTTMRNFGTNAGRATGTKSLSGAGTTKESGTAVTTTKEQIASTTPISASMEARGTTRITPSNDDTSNLSDFGTTIAVIIVCLLLLGAIVVMTFFYFKAKKTEKAMQVAVHSGNWTVNKAYGCRVAGAAAPVEREDDFGGFAEDNQYLAPAPTEELYILPVVGQREVYYGYNGGDNLGMYATETMQTYKDNKDKSVECSSVDKNSKKNRTPNNQPATLFGFGDSEVTDI